MNSLARLIRLMTSRSSREHATGGCHTPGRTTPTTHHTGRDTLAPLEAATYPIQIPIRLPSRNGHEPDGSGDPHPRRPCRLRPRQAGSDPRDVPLTIARRLLVRQVRAAEATDPEGRQWPRTKRSDDATAVNLVPS
jgi:hypothetical protein